MDQCTETAVERTSEWLELLDEGINKFVHGDGSAARAVHDARYDEHEPVEATQQREPDEDNSLTSTLRHVVNEVIRASEISPVDIASMLLPNDRAAIVSEGFRLVNTMNVGQAAMRLVVN